MARIEQLTTYPIKSCAGVTVTAAALTPAGLDHDRSFLVIDPQGRFRTQRRLPGMALIRPAVSAGGHRLSLAAPGADPMELEVDLAAPRRRVELFGRDFRGIDQGDAVAAWLTGVLGAPSRLVRVPPKHDRVSDGRRPGTSGYADSCAVLVTSRSSLDGLNERIRAAGAEPVGMDRFRPNLVVDGWPQPHTEDRVDRAQVGTGEIGFAKLAVRCVMVTIDQTTAARRGPEPLRTLASYRRADGGVCFGAKFMVLRPGRVAVGDSITVVGG